MNLFHAQTKSIETYLDQHEMVRYYIKTKQIQVAFLTFFKTYFTISLCPDMLKTIK